VVAAPRASFSESSNSASRTRRGQVRRRRDLDDLLVAALHRAVALVQVHDVAVLVAEDLHLDVAHRGRYFSTNTTGLPNAASDSLRAWRRSARSSFVRDDAHAAPAAAVRRLEDRGAGKPKNASPRRPPPLRPAAVRAGHGRHAGRCASLRGQHLVAEHGLRSPRRAGR
jgi:hypothetical protein